MWAVWLSVPVAATALAAIWSWLRSRPRRRPSTAEAMQAHQDYLDALAATARSRPGSAARRPDPEHERT